MSDKDFVPTLTDESSKDQAPSEAPGSDSTAKPSGLVNDPNDLPPSNAVARGDQSKNTGAPETDDYRKNPTSGTVVTSTHDRDSVKTGPETIGAGGPANPSPGPGSGDGLDDTPRGNPDAPQGTGPGINDKSLSSRDANKVQGEVRKAEGS